MTAIRIVVIDDEPVLRLTFQRLLEEHGYEVHVAENGQDGLELCRDRRPDLVITDLYMPEYDGYATIECLQEEFPDVPVIAMSAVIGPSGRQRTVNLGAVCCITKPVDMAVLLRMVEGIVKARPEPGDEAAPVSVN
ncbi:MAG: response regulator [Candidatus Hydrogenedentes bacterium]|nr:response regulator [Candidatus Hydrogenedentota bacterium]